jgi:galactose mutarotase-like enzyme
MLTKISFQNTTVTINHKGAELFQIQKGNKTYIWEINPNYWNKTSPILFPIVGSLKNNCYFIENISYSMLRHGFARDYNFDLIEKTDNKAIFSLKYNEETLKVYPFKFELQIIYIVEKNGLKINYIVKNISNQKMPFSIGAHPAFKIEGNIEDYSLEFENNESLITHHLENDLLNNKTSIIPLENNQLKLNYNLFEKDAIILKNNSTSFLKLLKNNELILKINFSDFPFLGIWTKKNAPFICIEPWLGIADNILTNGNIYEKEGIQILDIDSEFLSIIIIDL